MPKQLFVDAQTGHSRIIAGCFPMYRSTTDYSFVHSSILMRADQFIEAKIVKIIDVENVLKKPISFFKMKTKNFSGSAWIVILVVSISGCANQQSNLNQLQRTAMQGINQNIRDILDPKTGNRNQGNNPVTSNYSDNFSTTTAQKPANPEMPFEAGQKWFGRYQCGRVISNLRFDIESVGTKPNPGGDRIPITLVEDFVYNGKIPGTFRAKGTFQPSTRSLTLHFKEWVTKSMGTPQNVYAVVAPDGSSLAGDMTPSCSTLVMSLGGDTRQPLPMPRSKEIIANLVSQETRLVESERLAAMTPEERAAEQRRVAAQAKAQAAILGVIAATILNRGAGAVAPGGSDIQHSDRDLADIDRMQELGRQNERAAERQRLEDQRQPASTGGGLYGNCHGGAAYGC